jgi:hypothetical protein
MPNICRPTRQKKEPLLPPLWQSHRGLKPFHFQRPTLQTATSATGKPSPLRTNSTLVKCRLSVKVELLIRHLRDDCRSIHT